MAFIKQGTKTIAFAEYQDVLDQDTRLFEANEGLDEDIVTHLLIRSTDRILVLIRNTDWWRDLYNKESATSVANRALLPEVNVDLIKSRFDDFGDMCVYYALYNYILPKVADFSREDNAERAKIGYYQSKFQLIFDELINSGDWYDWNNSGIVEDSEKLPGNYQLKRIR